MPRFLLAVLAAVLLVLPATAEGQSTTRLRGTVALKSQATDLVTVRTKRQAVALRVPGSMSLIRIGQRIELRGSTLRAHGHGSRVLAHNVSIVSSQPLSTSSSPQAEDEDDEVEIKGKLTSLAPLTVTSATRSVTCSVPRAGLLAGFVVGDFVEITCDLVGGSWVLRELEHEDMADDDGEDDDRSGPGGGDDDEDDDHSGPGGGDDDDDDDDDSSGPGPGGDDDDD
ncbi:MAG: hypothetical protein HW413_2105 [Thermoleophilia bacterium]|nr:hypothetical protein [Thermoleophilia bacterium]